MLNGWLKHKVSRPNRPIVEETCLHHQFAQPNVRAKLPRISNQPSSHWTSSYTIEITKVECWTPDSHQLDLNTILDANDKSNVPPNYHILSA